jgi:hypothetical protein
VPELSWLTGYLDNDILQTAEEESDRRLVYSAFKVDRDTAFDGEVEFSTQALQLLLFEALENARNDPGTRQLCSQIFSLARTQLPQGSDVASRRTLLRICAIGWLADQWPLAAKLLVDVQLPVQVEPDASWSERVTGNLIDAWLLLLRKRDWHDIDALLDIVSSLRREQQEHERVYLEQEGHSAHPAAWELVSLYHLARAVEIIANFITQGESDKRFDVRQQVESHFDRAQAACNFARLVELSDLIRLLAYLAEQLLDNSLWSVARAAGPEATRFIEQVVSRGRGRPIFEVLPPQRQALSDDGLSRAAQRSVVVSLPTSAGKTLIAQFRIIQALSLFQQVRGWVAYVAPTRALVNQVTSRLRRDFAPMNIGVERVGPALEVDGIEAGILTDSSPETQFRILVATPEKLDIMLRGGWEQKIGRPLCLVVVDEAHNISSSSAGRGLKLELLLATINREFRDAQFLLLTPFIRNAREIAQWLDPLSHQEVQQSIDWQPNDRVIALSHNKRGDRAGDYSIAFETLVTNRGTLAISEEIPLGANRPLQITWSRAKSPNMLAAATSSLLQGRGATITLTQKPDHAWTVASALMSRQEQDPTQDSDVRAVQEVIAHEFGTDFPLVEMLGRGIGVHHSGLSDDIKLLTEWLLENGRIEHLVATTTIAQGVNFPVANVVFATHQYPYGMTMPPEDFWNIAGRAGRVDQGQVGVIALVAPDETRASVLRNFVKNNVVALNSTLVEMVRTAIAQSGGVIDLRSLSARPEWSSFVQFLAHTYRQIGNHEEFAAEVEQILRGTLGFQRLRTENISWANRLILSVRDYAEGLSGKPLSLVDSTGFSWESVAATLGRLSAARITRETWDSPLYGDNIEPLQELVGVMLEVPELRESLLEDPTRKPESSVHIASVVRDWVNGMSIAEIAERHFTDQRTSGLKAITKCCKRLFGDIAPTVAWGMSALQTLTLSGGSDEVDEERLAAIRNLPACAFYGVRSEEAMTLRMLGVPRTAALGLAESMDLTQTASGEGQSGESRLLRTRRYLRESREETWTSALGPLGSSYYRAWQIMEGTA